MFLTELQTEFLNIITRFILTVNHNTVSTCINICKTSFKCIFHRFSGNKTFTSCNNHKIICNLSTFSSLNFFTETFYCILCLNSISTKQGILFKTNLIFNNNCRNTKSFKSSYCKYKMFYFATSITIIDNRLSCTFKGII